MRKLLLKSMLILSLIGSYAYAQDRTVTGTVTAKEDGLPVPGVSVIVKGTTLGTQTNGQGKFTISVPESRNVLTFSFIGYSTIDMPIRANSPMNVVLTTDTKQLSEVVIVGAVGIERDKASVGYSADVVRTKELTQGRQTNLINGLTGKVPGVQIGRSSGGVNTATRITLRGVRSLQGQQQPLFVIDGVPVDNSSNQPSSSSANQVDVGNRIGDINPDDIESVTVLKGPNAAALYGSQGSNGAIIITTKTGKDAALRQRKFEVNVTSAYLIDQVQKLPELQNEFGSGYDGAVNVPVYDPIENTNWGPRFDGSLVQLGPTLANGNKLMIPYSAVPDNAKDFFDLGNNIQNSIAFQGGSDRGSFYTSFSDNEVRGVVPQDKFRRNTVKLSGSTKLANLFNVSGNISYNKNLTNTSFNGSGNGSVVSDIENVSREVDLSQFKDWQNYEFATTEGFFNGYQPNPYWALANNRFRDNVDRILGSFQAGFDPYKWLNVTYRLGTDFSADRRKQTFQKQTFGTGQRPTATTGSIIEDSFDRRILNSDLLVTFKKDLNKDFNTTLILLNNIRQDDIRNLTSSASAISIPGFFNLSNRVGELGGGEASSKKRILGFAGDLTVGYKDFIFLNGTLRNDRTSTLPRGNNSYYYPSASLSFVPTEAFASLKDNDMLSYAKLRASYAKVGSDTSPYNLVPTFGVGTGFPFGALAAFSLSNTTPNPNLKPEFTSSYEAGTELAFLKNRVGLDFTYYYTSTDGQIIDVGVSPATGFTAATVNAGVVTNKGIEVAFRGSPFSSANGFAWNFNFNYTHNTNNVKSLYLTTGQLSLGSGNPVPTAILGKPLSLVGSAYLRDSQGRVVVDATSGLIRLDPTLRNLGQVSPKHIFGFTNTFSFKTVSLSTTFDYRRGNVIFSGTKSNLTFTGSTEETTQFGRQTFVYPNSVIETSPGVFTPNTTVKTSSGSFDFWYTNFNSFAESNIVDAAFLKLRDISLNYTLPKRWLSSTPFGRANLALTGANILLWTPKSNKYIDPEASIFGTNNSQGREFTSIPSTRTYGLSLNVTF